MGSDQDKNSIIEEKEIAKEHKKKRGMAVWVIGTIILVILGAILFTTSANYEGFGLGTALIIFFILITILVGVGFGYGKLIAKVYNKNGDMEEKEQKLPEPLNENQLNIRYKKYLKDNIIDNDLTDVFFKGTQVHGGEVKSDVWVIMGRTILHPQKWCCIGINVHYPNRKIAHILEENLDDFRARSKLMIKGLSLSPETAPEIEESELYDPIRGVMQKFKKTIPSTNKSKKKNRRKEEDLE